MGAAVRYAAGLSGASEADVRGRPGYPEWNGTKWRTESGDHGLEGERDVHAMADRLRAPGMTVASRRRDPPLRGDHRRRHLALPAPEPQDRAPGPRQVIVLGPRAQEVLRSWLDRDPETYCFVPAETSAWNHQAVRRWEP